MYTSPDVAYWNCLRAFSDKDKKLGGPACILCMEQISQQLQMKNLEDLHAFCAWNKSQHLQIENSRVIGLLHRLIVQILLDKKTNKQTTHTVYVILRKTHRHPQQCYRVHMLCSDFSTNVTQGRHKCAGIFEQSRRKMRHSKGYL